MLASSLISKTIRQYRYHKDRSVAWRSAWHLSAGLSSLFLTTLSIISTQAVRTSWLRPFSNTRRTGHSWWQLRTSIRQSFSEIESLSWAQARSWRLALLAKSSRITARATRLRCRPTWNILKSRAYKLKPNTRCLIPVVLAMLVQLIQKLQKWFASLRLRKKLGIYSLTFRTSLKIKSRCLHANWLTNSNLKVFWKISIRISSKTLHTQRQSSVERSSSWTWPLASLRGSMCHSKMIT